MGVSVDTLDSIKSTILFEWTYGIVVANSSVHFYRVVAQLATFLFDLFKLSYGLDLFWPLTNDDLKPYSHYFISQNEIIYNLVESSTLTIVAIYGASCLVDSFSITGLITYFLLFLLHSSLSIIGTIFINDEPLKISSIEFLVWFLTITIEIVSIILVAIFILTFRLLSF